MRYLLDTDICSYAMKGNAPTLDRLDSMLPGNVCISAVTEAELRYGAKRKSKFESPLERFLLTMEVIGFGSEDAKAYASLRYALERAGTPIGLHDLMIAAQALALDYVLVTNNEREFRRVPGLKIENWAA